MHGYFAALSIVLLIGMVLTRVVMMRRSGIEAVHVGRLDKTDFFIAPFALFYIYTVLAAAFNLPVASTQRFFHSQAIAWGGVVLCFGSLLLFLMSLISFGQSFRVGIDTDSPDELVTTGVFAISRNPIYVAFGSMLIGQFLIFPNWILLSYVIGGAWLIHRQVLREEAFLLKQYGQEYVDYCDRVRRYL